MWWGVPLAVFVLLGAVGCGFLLQRLYPAATEPLRQSAQPSPRPSSDIAPIEMTPDALAHPDAAKIQWTLQLHFNAINMRQYETWKNTVVVQLQQRMPEDEWHRAYSTTRDAAIKVQRIEPGPGNSLRLLLTFISTQNPNDAPGGLNASCVRWRSVYPLVLESGAFRVDVPPSGGAIAQPC